MVLWYQRVMQGHPSPCRFSPSCSEYSLDALATYGSRRGLWLTIRRLSRCRPFGPSGWDPVPEPAGRHFVTVLHPAHEGHSEGITA